jgi:hypothetical protein
MIESIEKVKIEDKFISDEAVDPAIHDIIIKRIARHPDLEKIEDDILTPKSIRDKYEQRFNFQTENLVTRAWDLLHELEQIKSDIFLGVGIGNTLLVAQTSGKNSIHAEFNRIEMKQVYEMVQWCYEI